MTGSLKVALTFIALFACVAITTLTGHSPREPWDVYFFVFGWAGSPFGGGVLSMVAASRELREGPRRLQATLAFVLGLGLFVLGLDMLLIHP